MEYIFPPVDLLEKSKPSKKSINSHLVDEMIEEINGVLDMWNTNGIVMGFTETPISFCFDIVPRDNCYLQSITKIKKDVDVRIGAVTELVYSGKSENHASLVALKDKREKIYLRDVIESEEFRNSKSLMSIPLCVNLAGETVMANIEEMPHMLVAGNTGSGKTVFLDDILTSILYKATPDDVKFLLIDPKQVNMMAYNKLPHMLAPIIYKEKEIFSMFAWVETRMLERFDIFKEAGVKDINAYNEAHQNNKMFKILVVIDEYADLMTNYREDVEVVIERLSRMGRAAGVHLIIATQNPVKSVLSPAIKFNLPCRASFAVVDSVQSRMIMDKGGSQRLRGNGDMLVTVSVGSKIEHAQAPYVSYEEIQRVVKFIIENNSHKADY